MEAEAGKAGMSGEAAARRLDSAFTSAGSGVARTTSLIGGATSAILNAKTALAGVVALGAGGGLATALIGSNATLESSKAAFNVLVGDATKAQKLIGDVRKFAAATPFGEGELIEGSKALLRLTGANVEQNKKLLTQAAQLAAISPGKTIKDAAEAILDAEAGEFERLKEFGVKLKLEDVKKSKKRGETLGQASLRGFEEGLTKLTGGRDVVGALADTFAGRASTIKDRFGETIRIAGEPAFKVLSDGLIEFDKQLNSIESDPKFKEDFKAIQESLAGAARGAVDLVKALPQGVAFARALKDEAVGFAKANETLLKGGALLFGANKLTGGGLASGASSLGRRALFGSGGGVGGALAAAAGGGDGAAIPVRVVNVGDFGGLGGGVPGAAGKAGQAAFVARNTGGAGVGSTFKAFGGAISSQGALATLGVGGTAAGAGILGLFGAAAAVQLDVIQRTDRVVKAFEEREALERKATMDRAKTIKEQDRLEAEAAAKRNALTAGTRSFFDQALIPGQDPETRRQSLAQGLRAAQQALGGPGALIKGGKLSGEQATALAAVNESVRSLGIQFELGKTGKTVNERLRLVSGNEALSNKDNALISQFQKLNDLRAKDPSLFKQTVEGTPEFARLNKQATGLRERIGRGNLLGTELQEVNRRVQIGEINVNLPPGTDPTAAKVLADQIGEEMRKTLSVLDQTD